MKQSLIRSRSDSRRMVRHMAKVVGNVLTGLVLAMGWLPMAQAQEIRTVGPDGEFLNADIAIQTLFDPQLPKAPGPYELRLQVGSYSERVSVSMAWGLTLSGGWDKTFTTQIEDPLATRLTAGLSGDHCVSLPSSWIGDIDEGTAGLHVSNLSVTGGAGIELIVVAPCAFAAADVVVERVEAHKAPLYLQPSLADITLRDVVVRDSTTEALYCELQNDPNTRSAGILIDGSLVLPEDAEEHHIRLEGVRIHRNGIDGRACTNVAAAVLIRGSGRAKLTIEDLMAADNRAVVDPGTVGRQGTVLFIPDSSYWLPAWTGSVEARRLELRDNSSQGAQLGVYAEDEVEVVIGDSLVASSSKLGVAAHVEAMHDSMVALTNLTLVGGKTGADLTALDGAAVFLSNSIVTFARGAELVTLGGVWLDSNWIGGDPGFSDAATGNYILQAGSAAVDAGNNSPAGGLGPSDLIGAARLSGPAVDLGAYEQGKARPPRITCSGPGVFCTCFQEPVLPNVTRCALDLPGFDAWFRVPSLAPKFQASVEWQFLALEGGGWGLENWLDLPKQSLFQSKDSGIMAAGKSASGELLLDHFGAEGRAVLRSEIVVQPNGAKAPTSVTVEIELQP